MTLDNFIKRYTGQRIPDNSGNYPGECVSLVKRYAQEVLGVPNADAVLYVKDDKAKNLYYDPTSATKKYFDKVSKPQKGDIAVYDVGFYGDVAVATSSANVFGQYGTPIFTPATKRSILKPNKPMGYLRKKGEEDMPTAGNINTIIRYSLDRPPTDAELSKFSKLPWSSFVRYISETAPKRQVAGADKLANAQKALKACEASGGTTKASALKYVQDHLM